MDRDRMPKLIIRYRQEERRVVLTHDENSSERKIVLDESGHCQFQIP